MAKFILPRDDQRLVIVGRNGTGKTQAGAWQLAMRRLHNRRWIIFDFKGDELLNEMGATELDVGKLPKKPGLYITHPLPHQEDEVEEYLWKIWQEGHIGLFIDEGYMLGNSAAFRALLTQGRSKKIPMIILSQRPAWISRFVFSEANFYQVFHLNDRDDRKSMQRFVPYDLEIRQPPFHSVYYYVDKDEVQVLGPAADRNRILATVDAKLAGTKERLRLL